MDPAKTNEAASNFKKDLMPQVMTKEDRAFFQSKLLTASQKLNSLNSKIKSDKRGYWMRKGNFIKKLEYEEQVNGYRKALESNNHTDLRIRHINDILRQDHNFEYSTQKLKSKIYLKRHKKLKTRIETK